MSDLELKKKIFSSIDIVETQISTSRFARTIIPLHYDEKTRFVHWCGRSSEIFVSHVEWFSRSQVLRWPTSASLALINIALSLLPFSCYIFSPLNIPLFSFFLLQFFSVKHCILSSFHNTILVGDINLVSGKACRLP